MAVNYYAQLKDKLICELQNIFEPSENLTIRIKGIEDYFISLLAPKNMDGNNSSNIIILQKKSFENICVALMQNGVNEPDRLTVIRFFSAIDYYENQNKKT